MYNLTFYEAVEKCLNGEGFIRGDQFKDGVYVKAHNGTLVAVDGFNRNAIVGNLYVSAGMLQQKYKLFEGIESGELVNNNRKLTLVYSRAV